MGCGYLGREGCRIWARTTDKANKNTRSRYAVYGIRRKESKKNIVCRVLMAVLRYGSWVLCMSIVECSLTAWRSSLILLHSAILLRSTILLHSTSLFYIRATYLISLFHFFTLFFSSSSSHPLSLPSISVPRGDHRVLGWNWPVQAIHTDGFCVFLSKHPHSTLPHRAFEGFCFHDRVLLRRVSVCFGSVSAVLVFVTKLLSCLPQITHCVFRS